VTPCTSPGCIMASYSRGLCAGHYQQQRRGGAIKPLRVVAEGRISVRLSAQAMKRLGKRPGVKAREVIEAWAEGVQ
jgi:hypothetical protein